MGTVNPITEIVRAAHGRGIPVLVDGAQAVAHGPVDVRALGCDFYAFSGHKLFGPTGIGALYGTSALLESMPPYQSGGDMLLTAYALLKHQSKPSEADIREGLAGNLCRCTGYNNIVKAVQQAAGGAQ